MARWFYGDAAPKTIFDYVDSQGNILPQYLMNENKSEEAAEQSTNTENNKVDTSANKKPEYKKPKSNISGKEGAKDKPSWVTERPLEGQNGKKFAVQEMNKKFGVGKWDRSTANGAYDKIRKWADRNFE
jgi:hypothetical protein